MIICKVCRKILKNKQGLSKHLNAAHNLTYENYYDRHFRNYANDEGFCLECGKQTNFCRDGYNNFCSYKCSANNKNTKHRRKITSLLKYGVPNPTKSVSAKEKYKQTCLSKYGVDNVSKNKNVKLKKLKNIKNLSQLNKKPIYNYWNNKISWCEETRESKDGFLKVKCKKCGEYFIPNINSIRARIDCINGKRLGESNFYCSDECKNTCSIYNKELYRSGMNPNIDRPHQKFFAKIVKEKAKHECEICGATNNLVAHHIEPVKLRPDLHDDIDNGLCVCINCHKKLHVDECSCNKLNKIL